MTIKYKLLTIVMFACFTGLVIAGIAFIGWNQNMLRIRLVENLSTRAEMVAENCKVSLAFQDKKDAENILESMHVDAHIVFGGIFDDKGKLFAAYFRNDNMIKKIPENLNAHFVFEKNQLTVFRAIILDNQQIGTVCLQTDLGSISTSLNHSINIIAMVIAASLLAVFLISTRLQKVISNPLLNLTQMAKLVSEKKDYSARAEKSSNDEIGLLIDSFNEMLVQIQQRDSELMESKESLEIKVQQRTAEISRTNEKLVNEVNERQKAEEEIRKSQSILQNMIDAMPFGVLVVGKDKIIRRANNAVMKMTGFMKEELAGSICNCTLCPADKDACPIIDQGQTLDCSERKAITKDGRAIPIIKNVVPISWINGEEVLLEAFIDISERKKNEEQMKRLNAELESSMAKLAEANDEMKNFVYIASHDLREPLRKITAFGSMLEKSLEGKVEADDAENLKFMIDGATRMNKMIEGLLVYSRVSSKSLPPQVVDLNEIVLQLQQLELAVVLQEKNAVVEVPQPLPCVEADPVQIRQLLQNLIANGIKYQPKDRTPKIVITGKPAENGMVRIEVTDNGIGIKAEYLSSIFVMFKRLHTRTEYEGTGIGLSVCRKIVERHGGKIGVESEPEKGSTFWFTVPAIANHVELITDKKTDDARTAG
ncbi:MAG: ATP-binding protein [Phycisphaerales bacterium]